MTDNDRSLQLAEELRAAALKNLGRSSSSYRSSISGRFISNATSKRHPSATIRETADGTSASGKSARHANGSIGQKRS